MNLNLEKTLGLVFKNKNLLKGSFVHRSYLNEHPDEGLVSNERLEFLGDAVLEFLASEHLFQKFPQLSEGKLTSLRSKLVCEQSLAGIGLELGLGQLLLLSRGEEESGGRKNLSLLSNTFEALLGAIFLDQGLTAVRKFLEKHLFPKLETLQKLRDYKSEFQEEAQAKFEMTPLYKILEEKGPDHDKLFKVGVFLGKKLWGRGEGKSKQAAEQKAAQEGLVKMKAS